VRAGKEWPQASTLVVATVFVALAVIACLMPVHNDTWWHLRAGHDMLRDRSSIFVDHFSSSSAGSFFWNHSWLSQPIFYLLFADGGFPLLTAVCALLVVMAWAMVYRLMRGPNDLRLLVFAIAVAASTTIWSIRPQVFSIALLPIVTVLIARDRWIAVALLMVLWANLHAGMAIGVVIAGAALIAAALGDRELLVKRCAGAVAAATATLVTPLGWRNWTEMIESMSRSRANHIQEWMTTPLPPEQLFFWGLAAALLWQVARRWRELDREDRVIVVAALLALPLAVRTFRSVPAFMMLAAPAFTRLTWPRGALGTRPSSHRAAVLGSVILAAAAIAGTTVVEMAWSAPWPMLGWTPMSPAAAEAIASCPPRLYNTYDGGGPIIWYVPSQPVLLDSRQDPFPVPLVRAASHVEDTGDYEALFASLGINCAALPPSSPTASRLKNDGWDLRFKDRQWVVLARPSSRPRAAPTSPAP
jgi:hypothetical protein